MQVVQNDLFTVDNGDRPTVPDVAVLISDGQATVQTSTTVDVARAVRQRGVEIYFVAVGSDPNVAMIEAIVGEQQTGSHIISGLVTSADIVRAVADLADALCSR